MKRKKSARRRVVKRGNRPLYYIIIAVLVMAVFFSRTMHNQNQVLDATTSTSQQGFSLTSFFAPLFSFFSNNHALRPDVHSQVGSENNNTQGGIQTALTTSKTQLILTANQILALAQNAMTTLPLGDGKYVTDSPKKGYIYLCHAMQGNQRAQNVGSWISTNTWTMEGKPAVQGNIAWPNAKFSNTISGSNRVLNGNGLPVGMTTGIFPVSSSDPASQYNANPNKISVQTLKLVLPASPTYLDTPNCMGGEVGVMLNGVPLFNAFDEQLRDAAAHEVQDSCDGHPQVSGEYHYHNLSGCIPNIIESTVIGFALDGFPITGPVVSNGKYLRTDSLDECHGITSEITLDGKLTTIYHYVMTQDFPYSVSCFRGKPVNLQVISNMSVHSGSNPNSGQGGMQGSGMPTGGMQQGANHGQPPQVAITACSNKMSGTACSFSGQNGIISGTCQTLPGKTFLVCVPSNTGSTQHGSQPGGQQGMPHP